MQGVVTKVQVLAHPIVMVEGFGLKVLVRALLAGRGETFLDIVSRCAEEEARSEMEEFDLARAVNRFIGFERRARDLYRQLSLQFTGLPEASKFFVTLSRQEEGHAIVLSRVRREIRRGRLWTESKDLHLASVGALDALLAGFEEEARRGVSLARALEIVEGIEGSELDVVFDSLNSSVDMRSRARFERFFVLTQSHLAYCREQVRSLRARNAAGGQ
jgi:rubrerythrin